MSRFLSAAVGAILALSVVAVPRAAAAQTIDAAAVLAELSVSGEYPTGYDRALFPHWIDADANGCDTRSEVLQAESKVPVTFSSGCTVATGQWYSWYDGQTWTDAADVDIDHLVPLAEAWASGAWAWTTAQRQAYANDLGLPTALEAVTDNVNQSKGDRDPAGWMPPLASAACDYAVDWVLVKYRWRLSVDQAEKAALGQVLQGDCGARPVDLPAVAIDAAAPVTFTDVPSGTQFYPEISWLASRGVSTGWPEADGTRTYRPLVPVARDAMAAFLYRLAGLPAYTPPALSPFADVKPSAQFYKEITWLASQGISTGWSEADGTKTYRPLSPVNRDAMAAFLYRYAGSPSYSAPASSPFTDTTTGTQFYREITWLASQGISTGWDAGYGCRSYQPVQPVARDAMAAFMYRSVNGGAGGITWTCTPPAAQPAPTPAPTQPAPAPAPSKPANPGDAVNCSSFATWQAAQTWFDTYYPYYGDAARLDSDGDRIACESLPGHP